MDLALASCGYSCPLPPEISRSSSRQDFARTLVKVSFKLFDFSGVFEDFARTLVKVNFKLFEIFQLLSDSLDVF